MNPLDRTRLEKAASDCGFELSPEMQDGALIFRSAQFPEYVSVRPRGNEAFSLTSDQILLLPISSSDELVVSSWDDLYQVLEKAAAIARTMPNRVAEKFHNAIAGMPRSTEVERLVLQRVGQDLFRSALLDFWGAACCITGLAIPELLKASHIKPWARCDSDEERLDVFNGLLLAPHLDALFDGGWLTVQDTGRVRFSSRISGITLEQLGLPKVLEIGGLSEAHRPYLSYHRAVVFKG
jgi:hypothetical protein